MQQFGKIRVYIIVYLNVYNLFELAIPDKSKPLGSTYTPPGRRGFFIPSG